MILSQAAFVYGVHAQSPEIWLIQLKEKLASSSISWDDKLQKTAEKYVKNLADRGVLSHRDEKGNPAAVRAQSEGMGAGTVGEILGAGKAWDLVLNGWLQSPTHKQILDDPQWTHWGAARLNTGKTWIYVALFWKTP